MHERDCPKPWDWCAAYVIAREAGVHFLRLDGATLATTPDAAATAAPFAVMDCGSACCAGSSKLADLLQALICSSLANADE